MIYYAGKTIETFINSKVSKVFIRNKILPKAISRPFHHTKTHITSPKIVIPLRIKQEETSFDPGNAVNNAISMTNKKGLPPDFIL
jgi:hypothetical protein